MTATSRDVARAAGVSVATVSRAFSENGSVSQGTKRRVLTEAARLGYYPDPAARRLITGFSGNVGLIVPDISNPFFADTAKGVERATRMNQMGLFISDTDGQDRLEADAIRRICRQVDGLIWASPRTPVDLLEEFAGTVPIVLLHRRLEGWWSVSTDLADGMGQALRNLYSLGHRRIAYAGGPQTTFSGQLRQAGLAAASRDLGVELIELGSFAPNSTGGMMAADLALATDATAVVAFNDAIGLGILARMSSRGMKVPQDLSIVSCDDIAYAQISIPPLTTVHVPRFDAGAAAVAMLQEMASNPDAPPQEKILPTQLVIRRTTSVPVAH